MGIAGIGSRTGVAWLSVVRSSLFCVGLLSLCLPHAAGPASAAEGEASRKPAALEVRGFIDALMNWTPGGARTGFSLNDGEVSLSKTFGLGEGHLDVPFAGNLSSPGKTFDFNTEKAQAYVGYRYHNGLRWKAGQFDTLFGYEANRSIDRRFTSFGILSNQLLVYTHTGALVGYDWTDKLGLSVFVANSNGKGEMNGKFEYGAQVAWTGAPVRASLGGSLSRDNDYADNRMNSLLSLVTEASSGKLTVAMELDSRQTAGITKRANGAALHFGYALVEPLELGLRTEYLKNAPPGSPGEPVVDTQSALAFGPKYQLADEAFIRAEYTLLARKAEAGSSNRNSQALGISVATRF